MKNDIRKWGIDHSWTLFLDRDGVINQKINDDYVRQWSEFYFIDGFLDAIPILTKTFKRLAIVTNQRGIGRGLMTADDLALIFENLQKEFQKLGGNIDAFYHCPHDYSAKCSCRKPKIGMGLQARADFPDLDFRKALIVGDSISDMEFGKKLGMKTVFVTNREGRDVRKYSNFIDASFDDVKHFATQLAAL